MASDHIGISTGHRGFELGLALLLIVSMVIPSLAADFELTRLALFQTLATILVATMLLIRNRLPALVLSLPVLLLLLWVLTRCGSALLTSGAYRPWQHVGRDGVLVAWTLWITACGRGALIWLWLPRLLSMWSVATCVISVINIVNGSGFWASGSGGSPILGFSHPNSFACVATLSGFVALAGVFQASNGRLWRGLCLLGVFASLGIQVVTDCRSGLFLSLGLLPLQSWCLWSLSPGRPKLSIRLIALAVFALLMGVMLFSIPVLQTRLESVLSGRGTMARIGLWHATQELIAQDRTWTGRGPGALAYEAPRIAPYVRPDGEYSKIMDRHSHNGYFELWLESGVFSLLFWGSILWILFSGIREAFRCGRPELIGGLFAVGSYLLFGIHSIATLLIGPQILFHALLGLILAITCQRGLTTIRAALWLPLILMAMVVSLPMVMKSHEASRLLHSLLQSSGPVIDGTPRAELIGRAVAMDGKNADLRMEQLYRATIRGDSATAKEAFQALQKIIPGHSNSEVLYSRWLASCGMHGRAAKLLGEFAVANPHLLGVWIHLAIHQKNAGDDEGRATSLLHILSHSIERLNRRHALKIRLRGLDGSGLSRRVEITGTEVHLPPFPLRLLDQTLLPTRQQDLEARGRLAMARLIRFFEQLGVRNPDLLRD